MSTRLGSAGYSCRGAADAEDGLPGLVSAVLTAPEEVEVVVEAAAVVEEAAAVVRSAVEVHDCKGMGGNVDHAAAAAIAATAVVPVDRPYDYFSLESLSV